MELYLDFRSARDKETSQQSPEVEAGELYTDTEFDVQRAIENYDGLEWKRPGVSGARIWLSAWSYVSFVFNFSSVRK